MKSVSGSRCPFPLRLARLLLPAVLFFCAAPALAARHQIGAHRGNSAFAPENTLAAFRACSNLADFVEFDLRLSADGHLVVIHDPSVDRTTTSTGLVSSLTLDQIKQLDAGSKFSSAFANERIPTFAEALRAIPPGVKALVHCLTGTPAGVLAVLRAENALSNSVVYSDNWSFLAEVRSLEPSAELCAGIGTVTPEFLAYLQSIGVRQIATFPHFASPETIDLVHSMGMAIQISGTVMQLQPFLGSGVDRFLVHDPRLGQAMFFGEPSPNPVLARDLVAYWKFDDSLLLPNSAALDDVEDLSHGSLRGFGPYPSWFSDGAVAGGALSFDGVNDHVAIPTNAALNLGANAVTLSAWVRLSSLPSETPNGFACIFDDLHLDAYTLYLDAASRELRFKSTDVAGHASRPGIGDSLLSTGVWHHVVGVYDGSASPSAGQTLLYLDGVLRDVHVGSDASPRLGHVARVRPGQSAAFGRNGIENNFYFRGDVDDVAVWRRPLSPAEIRQIHRAGASNVPLERLVASIWIDGFRVDPATSEIALEVRVEHGSLSRQDVRMLGARAANGPYVPFAILPNGEGRRPAFHVLPHPSGSPDDPAFPRFFHLVLP